MLCSKCGKELLVDETICSNCGYDAQIVNSVEPKIVADSIGEEAKSSDMHQDVGITNDLGASNNKKNKKGTTIALVVLGTLIFLVIILLVISLFSKKPEKALETKKLIENNYTMYIKINPLVKLNVKETYYECINEESGVYEKCSDVTDEVISYNLVNSDAKEIYKDIDLKTKNVVDALATLYDVAKENEIEFTDIEITTNWDNRYSKTELVAAVKEKIKYSEEFNIVLDIEKGNISTDVILNKYGINEDAEITYMVIFNSDGGSTVLSQEIKEKEKVAQPTNPTKNGYSFVEWQLNGVKYDFDSEIVSDIELKAKWQQIVVKDETNKQDKPVNQGPQKEEVPKQEVPKQETPKPEVSTPEVPKEEVKPESSLTKINLNDNIMVELHEGINPEGMLMGYVFVTNAEEVFGSDIFVADNGQKMVIVYNDDIYEKFNRLIFNDVLESSALNMAANAGSLNLPAGVKSFVCTKDSRRLINCQTKYLSIAYDMWEKFPSLTDQLENSVNVALQYPRQIFGSDALYISPGAMGVGPSEPILLTEQLCAEYHLACDRW